MDVQRWLEEVDVIYSVKVVYKEIISFTNTSSIYYSLLRRMCCTINQ